MWLYDDKREDAKKGKVIKCLNCSFRVPRGSLAVERYVCAKYHFLEPYLDGKRCADHPGPIFNAREDKDEQLLDLLKNFHGGVSPRGTK